MNKRKALQLLDGNIRRGKTFTQNGAGVVSTSKTPKISNRAVPASKGKPPLGKSHYSAESNNKLITLRNRRKRWLSPQKSPAPLPRISKVPTETPENELTTAHSPKNRVIGLLNTKPSTHVHTTPTLAADQSDDDMDLSSSTETSLFFNSSTSTPDKEHKPSKLELSKLREEKPLKAKQNVAVEVSSSRPLPPHLETQNDEKRSPPTPPDRESRHRPPLQSDYMQHIRETPADDPSVLQKVLYGGHETLLGAEIGGNDWQQESLDGSEITSATFLVVKNNSKIMPSFDPIMSPPSIQRRRSPSATDSRTTPLQQWHDGSSDDLLEEWSLPDSEANSVIEFTLNGKKYLHDPLPPGWRVKVSQAQKRPYYTHPDHGVTWHCPVILKPKSKARVFRRSRGRVAPLQLAKVTGETNVNTSKNKAPSPPTDKLSFDGDMSDLIRYCTSAKSETFVTEQQEGYDGSISGASSSESLETNNSREESKEHVSPESELNGDLSTEPSTSDQKIVLTKPSTVDQEGTLPEWETPLRQDIVTPQGPAPTLKNKQSAKTMTKLPSIDELVKVQNHSARSGSLPFARMYQTASASKGDTPSLSTESISPPTNTLTTPRVSFDPVEIGSESSTIERSGSKLEKENVIQPITPRTKEPTVNGQNESAGCTPVSDADEPQERVEAITVEVRTCNQSARSKVEKPSTMETPEFAFPLVPSRAGAPAKRKVRLSLSRATPGSASHVGIGYTQRSTPGLHRIPFGTVRFSSQRNALGRPIRLPASVEIDRQTTGKSIEAQHTADKSPLLSAQKESPAIAPTFSAASSTAKETPPGAIDNRKDFGELDEWSPLRDQTTPREICDTTKPRVVDMQHTTPTDDECLDSGNSSRKVDQRISEVQKTGAGPTLVDMSSFISPSTPHPDSTAFQNDRSNSTDNVDEHVKTPSQASENIAEYQRKEEDSFPADTPGFSVADSPIASVRKELCRPFGWPVLHPIYPLCSLQRIDELLKEQKRKKSKVSRRRRSLTFPRILKSHRMPKTSRKSKAKNESKTTRKFNSTRKSNALRKSKSRSVTKARRR